MKPLRLFVHVVAVGCVGLMVTGVWSLERRFGRYEEARKCLCPICRCSEGKTMITRPIAESLSVAILNEVMKRAPFSGDWLNATDEEQRDMRREVEDILLEEVNYES